MKENTTHNMSWIIKRLPRAICSRIKRYTLKLLNYIKYQFMPIQNNKVVFGSYFGRRYNDSPRQISEELQRRNLGLDIVWAFRDMDEYVPNGVRKIKYGTPEYMKELATAKVWVNNVRDWPRPAKKKKQIYLQTMHGSFAVKAVEKDAEEQLTRKYVTGAKQDGKMTTAILSSNKLQTERILRAYWINKKAEILEYGLPRNDVLLYLKEHDKEAAEIKREITDENNIVILYAPTFRDDFSLDGYRLDFEQIIHAFEKLTGKNCVLVLRMHPNRMKQNTDVLKSSDKIIDGTYFPNGEALSAVSDYLITDYSGILYNFVLLEKPVFLCTLDLEHYQSIRKLMPVFYELPFPRSTTSAQLIDEIENFDYKKYAIETKRYFSKNPAYDKGDATQKTVDWLVKSMRS